MSQFVRKFLEFNVDSFAYNELLDFVHLCESAISFRNIKNNIY